ncbi:MAG: hypothetical protein K5770_09205 [Lachnospiraceae bacterium]|nr:hypothetical protein [Lachnospiraceae bacterium]
MLAVYIAVMIICIALFLYIKKNPAGSGRQFFRQIYSQEVLSDMKKICTGYDLKRQTDMFYRKKISRFITILFISSILASLVELKELNEHELIDNRMLKREGYLGNTRKVDLWARQISSGDKEKLSVTVSEKRYSNEILDQMVSEIEPQIPAILLKNNTSADHIEKNLDLKSSIEGFPFTISYKTDNPSILTSSGEINQARLLQREDAYDGVAVKVLMDLKYEDYSSEISFYVRVYPEISDTTETFFDSLKAEITNQDEITREKDFIELPTELSGSRVIYEEPVSCESLIFFGLGLIIAVLLYKKKDEELKNVSKLRDEQMCSDYPMIVNKFALFYSVGMTTKGIFIKLCRDYEEKKGKRKDTENRYVYEEMLKTRKKMEEGIGEIAAYEDFAQRCAIQKYRQLVNLMEQAVIKGKSDIGSLLSDELSKAFLERKNRARELSERAGTKLLLPMFLMLLVVIIVIMIPAFLAFRM